MIKQGKPAFKTRDSCTHRSFILATKTAMEVKTPKCMQPSSLFSSQRESELEGSPTFSSKGKKNPFADTFPDPLCKLNLKETSDFVKAFPMAKNTSENSRAFLEIPLQKRESVTLQKRFEQAPSTPGRPVFSFSGGNLSKKSFPSKWDDAEKWLISSYCQESPSRAVKTPEFLKGSKHGEVFQQKKGDLFRVAEENISGFVTNFSGSSPPVENNSAFHPSSSDILLKDKFTDNVEPVFPKFQYSGPTKEGFLFGNSVSETMKDASTEVVREVQHRDIGTEMTPLGSSTTSRCHTPFKISSPARHNTPTCISGPLAPSTASIDIAELQDCHFAKLQLDTQFNSVIPNWSSREDEEEEISKSLRHFEMGGSRKSVTESRASLWEEEEKSKSCIRYQREEAKIQAWVNLQSAKAEAQSKKLEVKIEKMRSNLEEKLMKKMATVERRAEEWRAAAQFQHSQQIQRASEQAQKMKNQQKCSDYTSCGCFPCNNHI